MSRKALLADLQTDSPELMADLAKVAVAADLSVLLAHAHCSRAELANRLGWSRARVTQVLSGDGNLTIETVHAVARALGQTFDVVFRKPDERRQPQAWERGVAMAMSHASNVAAFPAAPGASMVRMPRPRWDKAATSQHVYREHVVCSVSLEECLNAA
jgi:transcriptional regulator with XRE-family HTH domain